MPAVAEAGERAGLGLVGPGGEGLCPFLEVDTIPGRHWVCGKRRTLGSWDAVHRDADYMRVVGVLFRSRGTALCGDWKVEGQCCFGPDNPPVM